MYKDGDVIPSPHVIDESSKEFKSSIKIERNVFI